MVIWFLYERLVGCRTSRGWKGLDSETEAFEGSGASILKVGLKGLTPELTFGRVDAIV